MSINIKLKNQDGIVLKTADKLCEEDIVVIPELATIEEPYVPSGETQIVSVPEGYAGIKSFTIAGVNTSGVHTQEATVSLSTSEQTLTPDEGYDGFSKITVPAVTSAIDSDIVPEKIKEGVTILGVTGALKYKVDLVIDEVFHDSLEEKVYRASDYGALGFNTVTIPAVTVENANIKAEYLRKGITLLGVTGTYEGEPVYKVTVSNDANSYVSMSVWDDILEEDITLQPGESATISCNTGSVTIYGNLDEYDGGIAVEYSGCTVSEGLTITESDNSSVTVSVTCDGTISNVYWMLD